MSARIDCGIVAISEEDVRARELGRAILRTLTRMVRALRTGFCRHHGPQLTRTRNGIWCVECMECGHHSPGIRTH